MKSIFLYLKSHKLIQLILIWIPLACLFITVTTTEMEFWWIEFSFAFVVAVVTASFVHLLYFLFHLQRLSFFLQIILQFLFAVPGIFLGYKAAYAVFSYFKFPILSKTSSYDGVAFFYMGFVFLLIAVYEQHQKTLKVKHEAELKSIEIQNQTLQIQLKTLSLQLSPHFLFNSLNTLIGVIHADPKLAEHMILKIAELYRGIVLSTEETEHSLLDEYRLCESYLEIEKIRFGERLQYSFDVHLKSPLDRYMVPVLFLQPLIDNAVKYGVSLAIKGGTIQIEILEDNDFLQIQIRNSLENETIGASHPGTQTSLVNIKKRLELIYGFGAKVITNFAERQACVTLLIPRSQVLCEDFV